LIEKNRNQSQQSTPKRPLSRPGGSGGGGNEDERGEKENDKSEKSGSFSSRMSFAKQGKNLFFELLKLIWKRLFERKNLGPGEIIGRTEIFGLGNIPAKNRPKFLQNATLKNARAYPQRGFLDEKGKSRRKEGKSSSKQNNLIWRRGEAEI